MMQLLDYTQSLVQSCQTRPPLHQHVHLYTNCYSDTTYEQRTIKASCRPTLRLISQVLGLRTAVMYSLAKLLVKTLQHEG